MALSDNLWKLIEEIKREIFILILMDICIYWLNEQTMEELQYKHHAFISWQDENCAYWNGEVGR